MLFRSELLPDMPDCAEEVVAWAPMSYEDYFRTAHYRERDLAVDAYRAADPAVRGDFDAAVTHLDCVMAEALALVEGHDPNDPACVLAIRDIVRERLKPLISRVGGIINGPAIALEPVDDADAFGAQAVVDELFP